ncbi:Pimeloyl-ACP methyl ester carboxylesterase [Bradyrhizobium sp. NFR13]|uniref:alpha/beta fold hydrolase n=1 Tax=Bradyrhizobium sp. NFR13 TaxID=1566285 RepID=UPI0008E3330D|nr:alpha/beta hydrolase [Bradyrhizobium sp. NFR13]SFM23867.1 Pimeloyl-ACP methyl ester carboxylesterase [Bradyrhizobium sp. NFR13]
MPHVTTPDGTQLYYEEVGTGSPVVFVHEYAGDYRTWEPQLRYFSRSYRCITYSQRGYPPSDVPTDPARYGQDIARDDVIALMDALKIDKAHIVGHSMGASTALHVGIHYPGRCLSVTAASCGYGSSPDSAFVEQGRAASRETAKMFETVDFPIAAARYADGATRQTHKNKDPRGFAEFARMLADHSPVGHALTMRELQAKRPMLWEMKPQLEKFTPPLLIIVGDEDDWCLDPSIFLKRTVPTAGLLVLPRAGHTITSEEPAAFNAALAELFPAAESGRWMSHKPAV